MLDAILYIAIIVILLAAGHQLLIFLGRAIASLVTAVVGFVGTVVVVGALLVVFAQILH